MTLQAASPDPAALVEKVWSMLDQGFPFISGAIPAGGAYGAPTLGVRRKDLTGGVNVAAWLLGVGAADDGGGASWTVGSMMDRPRYALLERHSLGQRKDHSKVEGCCGNTRAREAMGRWIDDRQRPVDSLWQSIIAHCLDLQFALEVQWKVTIADVGRPAIGFLTDPVGAREVFRLRDIPSDRERRAAILHWVAEHDRKSRIDDGTHLVRAHLRGESEFNWNGLRVEITPSRDDMRKGKKQMQSVPKIIATASKPAAPPLAAPCNVADKIRAGIEMLLADIPGLRDLSLTVADGGAAEVKFSVATIHTGSLMVESAS